MRVTGTPAMLAGHAGSRRSGEEQFVVFAAVESLGEGCGRVNGQGGRIDFGGDAGLLAQVGEIGGEAVAEVDGGGGHGVARQPQTLSDAGLREKVRGEQRLEAGGNARKRRRFAAGAARVLDARRPLREAGEARGGAAQCCR